MVGWQYPMYHVLAVAYMQPTQFLAVKSPKTMPVESVCFFVCFSRLSPMISTASIGQGRPGLLFLGYQNQSKVRNLKSKNNGSFSSMVYLSKMVDLSMAMLVITRW